MAVVGDNRGVRDRPVAQRPDGSWSFEDARRRRDQREGGGTAPGPPTTGDPEEDLSALALSLADNLTIDGTPLSELGTAPETRRQRRSRAAGWRRSDRRGDHARARDRAARSTTDQHQRRRGLSAGSLGAPTQHAAGWARSLATRSSVRDDRLHRQRRRYHCARAPAGLRRRYDRSTAPRPRAVTGTAATTASLNTATARFLAEEHAADRKLVPARSPRTRAARLSRHRQTSLHPPARRASTSSSNTTHRPAAHPKRSIPRNSQPPQAPARPRAPHRQDQVKASPTTQPHTSPSPNKNSAPHPIQSHPPLTRHRSRHLQLPVGPTRPTPTGR